ncbi:MAG TPA: DUF2235 domain-containing protein [Gemmatimonadaceae bacterium]|jgi:uncharacterized protein (DUF2235 family)
MALYAFDGTWNSEHDTGVYGVNTNVVEFARAYDGRLAVVQEGAGGAASVRDDFYEAGLGTRHGWLGKIIGGAFGVGGHERMEEGKAAIAKHFAEGDETIDVIGFSRGAALALHFTNIIRRMTFPNQIGQQRPVSVRFLGLWDVVAAFGIPLDLGPLHFTRINLGFKLTLGDHVQHCFHAVSLDEKRDAFRETRVDNGYQVWFRGVHSDVGGGDENSGLSNITLRWMLRKAMKVGLPVDPGLADRLVVDPSAGTKPASLGPSHAFRALKPADRIHYTVSARDVKQCQDPPSGCPVETEDDEKNLLIVT